MHPYTIIIPINNWRVSYRDDSDDARHAWLEFYMNMFHTIPYLLMLGFCGSLLRGGTVDAQEASEGLRKSCMLLHLYILYCCRCVIGL